MALFRTNGERGLEEIPSLQEETVEAQIESLLETNPRTLQVGDLLVLGRQVATDTGKRLDLLAIDQTGRLVLAELKRGMAPRETIAQVMDYSVWARTLSEKALEDCFRSYRQGAGIKATTLHEEYRKVFRKEFTRSGIDDVLMIIFARAFPVEVIRAVEFMSEKNMSVACIAFDMYRDPASEVKYLSTRVVAGNPFESEPGSDRSGPDASSRAIARALAKRLESTFGGELAKSGFARRGVFKTFRQPDGSYISTYCDWKYAEGVLCFEIQFHTDTVYLLFWNKEHSKLYDQKTSRRSFSVAFSKYGFEPVIEEGESPYYQIQLKRTHDSDEGLIEELLDLIREKCLPILQKYLDES